MAGMQSGLVILTVLLLSGSVAVAQQAGKPCAGDIKTLCAGVQPGEGRIKACIKSHLTNLSPTCEDRVLTGAVTAKVCKTDVTNLCAGIVPGTGGIRACIKSHMAEVSDPCRDAMSQAAAGKKILGEGIFRNHCPRPGALTTRGTNCVRPASANRATQETRLLIQRSGRKASDLAVSPHSISPRCNAAPEGRGGSFCASR